MRLAVSDILFAVVGPIYQCFGYSYAHTKSDNRSSASSHSHLIPTLWIFPYLDAIFLAKKTTIVGYLLVKTA